MMIPTNDTVYIPSYGLCSMNPPPIPPALMAQIHSNINIDYQKEKDMLFNRNRKSREANLQETANDTADSQQELDVITNEPEEWIWVTGFKGTNGNMTCIPPSKIPFQYELNKLYTHDGDVAACNGGFHFGMTLKDVQTYYTFNPDATDMSRYFVCKALVRKSDYEQYGKPYKTTYHGDKIMDKLAAKEIILTRELTDEEYYQEVTGKYYFINSPEDYRALREKGYRAHVCEQFLAKMDQYGYSNTFARLMFDIHYTGTGTKTLGEFMKKAIALVDEGVSTDLRIYLLMK